MRRRLRVWSCLLASAIVVGCVDTATESGGPNVVAGEWTYRATQSTPMPSSSEGRIQLEGEFASDIVGEFAGVERNVDGISEAVAGIVSARMVGGETLDMTIQWPTGARRHIGVLSGDSVTGAWSTSTAPIASGSFLLVRP